MTRQLYSLTLVAIAALAVPAAGAGCAPGTGAGPAVTVNPTGPVSTDPARAGRITLTEWDQNTDPGTNAATEELNRRFHQRYPNITVKRVSRSFSDLKATLRLALSSDDPPDVIQANQGYPDMGAFVEAHLLQPVDRYAKVYGWTGRYPQQLLDLNRFSPDGRTWKTGSLYGISQTGELVGVFYNKQRLAALGLKPPATVADLAADLARARAAGQLPLQFGNSDKSPAIHLLGVVQAATAGKQVVRDLVFDQHQASWTGAGTRQAAQQIQDWAARGYLAPGFNGQTSEQARAAFGAGQGVFLLDGTWGEADLAQRLGGNVGFTVLAPRPGAGPLTQGGEGLAWAITSRTRHADAAAAYLEWLTNRDGMTVAAAKGNLPAVPPPGYQPAAGTVHRDILTAWTTISGQDGLLPYLDYATPTFYNTLTAALQELLARQQTPRQFTQTLQTDYQSFQRGK